jgi:phenylacetate-CoA ligase
VAATGPAPLGRLGRHADAVASVVERAVATTPLWAARLGPDAARRPFAELATTTKSDLAGWGPFPLQAGPPSAAARFCATSGTTGDRLFVGFSAGDWDRVGARLAHRAGVAGVGPGDLLANTHGYGLWVGGPSLDLLAGVSGAGLLPLGPGHTDQLLEWLGAWPITALSATPSFLRYLVEQAGARGVDTGAWSLRVGFIGGEGAAPSLRRQVIDALGGGFRWQELYGSTEAGGPILGWSPPSAPEGGRLALDTDELVVEVLALDGDHPAGPGEVGEVTVTTPYRELSPLVRYRTRDLVTVAEGDGSGTEGFPVVSSVVGRVDDAVKVRGALVYPAVVEQVVVAATLPGAEWRIELDRDPGRLDVLTVRVEHPEPALADELADALHHALGVRAAVAVVEPGSLERFTGKARRVVDRRRG